jgi:hypothetical protein
MLTPLLCFVRYHYFVRATFIGRFLDGRWHTRGVQQERIVALGAAAGAKKG